MIWGCQSSCQQGGFEQKPDLWTLPASTSGTSKHTCGGASGVYGLELMAMGRAACSWSLRAWALLGGTQLPGAGILGDGGSALPTSLSLFPTSASAKAEPDKAPGTRGTLAATRCADPCGPAPASRGTLFGATATQVSGLPLIGSSLKVGGGAPLRQECCLVN